MFGQIPPTPYDLRFRAFGVPVRVHPIFWLTAAFLAWRGSHGDLRYVLIRVLCIFVAILVHELGHALVTRYFGWQPEIVLYFFGGYATSARHSTFKDIAVSAAGPAAGFGLLFAIWMAEPVLARFDLMREPLLRDALYFSRFINLLWNCVNLLPVLPLDGGHISREICCWLAPRKGMQISLGLSTVVAGLVVLLCLRSRMARTGVFGLDPLFLGIMFGYLAYQSYQAFDAARRGYW
jgi:Zn-dependent protease